jgi:sporulation protein YlmC with PRC-barrel domain
MLKLSVNLYNIPIISLRTGAKVGLAERPIINPNNLKIEGWYAQTIYEKGIHVLPSAEIREIARIGIAVNDHEAITHPDELVRMKKVIELNFELQNKLVVTESKKRLGRVEDYASDLESFYIQRLYVRPTMLNTFRKDQITVSRQQIVEITDRKIIIKDIEATERAFLTAPVQVPEG